MKHIDNQTLLKRTYEQAFALKVTELVARRKKLRANQVALSSWCGCSLRKIQLFENHKSFDAFLIYAYKKYFKNQIK